jgi:hypothetical protein
MLLCQVGSPTPLDAFLVIDESNMSFVRKGQQVRLHLEETPGRVLAGAIVEIAKTDLKVAPRELARGTDLPTTLDEKGVPRPLATSYHARVALDGHEEGLLMDTRGRAKILADSQRLGQRLLRYLQRTFKVWL